MCENLTVKNGTHLAKINVHGATARTIDFPYGESLVLPVLARFAIDMPDHTRRSNATWPTSSVHKLHRFNHARICQTRTNSLTAFVVIGMDDVSGIDWVHHAIHEYSCEHRRVLSVHANSLADGLNGDACFGTWSVC